MNRRRYLAVAGVPLLAGVAGCLDAVGVGRPEEDGGDAAGGTGDGPETDTSPGSTPPETSDPARDVGISLRNSTPEGATVRISVTRGGTPIFEEEVGVPPDGGRSVDPRIEETGRYELEVAVEGGPDGSYPFSVEEYDLRMGSNLIVVVEADDVRVMIEE